MKHRQMEETLFKALMVISVLMVTASLLWVLAIILLRGIPALNLATITQLPKGGYYLGKEGGVLNAITGSLCLAFGATLCALTLSLPVVFYLQKDYGGSRFANITRLALDVLWGVPSIVYGAFGFIMMLYLGLRASLLGGIIALTFVEMPIMARAMDEVIRMTPSDLKAASYALGATRFETSYKVVWRQALAGIITAVLLAFGRGIGDAASILLTTGYTDRLPSSFTEPVASLPLAVFFLLGTPFPEVQQRAYASGAILLGIVLIVSLISRTIARRYEQHIIR